MSTASFDKRIILDDEAAGRLAEALSRPPKRIFPDLTKFEEESEEKWQSLLSNLQTSSEHQKKSE